MARTELGMKDPDFKDWRIGYQRLLAAAADLRLCNVRLWPVRDSSAASVEHHQLFSEYEKEILQAVSVALKWWNGMLDYQMKRFRDRQKVLRNVWTMYPAGPASEPTFVSVVRKYWLACVHLNLQTSESGCVSPEILLLAWLAEAGHKESVEVITQMPYWPIGLNRDGNWV